MVVISVWLTATLVGALPLFGWNRYVYEVRGPEIEPDPDFGKSEGVSFFGLKLSRESESSGLGIRKHSFKVVRECSET